MPLLAAFPKGFFLALVEGRMSLFQWLELAAQLDLDGVELYPRFFESFDRPYLARVRSALATSRLRMPMLCHSPDFTQPEAAERLREVERTRRMIQLTAALGGRYCRVLSGQNRPGLDPEEALGWVVGCLRELMPHAEAAGVVMVMENHYKDGLWLYPEFAQSHARYLAILEAVDSPWLKAQYDPSNAIVAGEDQYELLERVLPRLATVQASDRYLEGGTHDDLRRMAADPQHGYAPFLKHGVIGRGLNDYDRIFGALAGASWDGWVSIEDGEGPTIEEGMANLRESAAFLRGMLARHFGARPAAGHERGAGRAAVTVSLDGRPKVQLSLDLVSLEEALATAEIGVRAGVDWLEAGTPLILAEGSRAVRALHERFPGHPVVADLKTMDAGYLESEMMFRAGAAFVVVMAVAHERTVREAVRAAREYGGRVMADLMLDRDKPAAARRLEGWGVDVILVHVGYDERHHEPGRTPLSDLDAVRAAVRVPLQAVGGLSIEQAARLPALGAPLVVIGAPLAVADREFRPAADPEGLFRVLSEFVAAVKGGA